MTIAIMQPYFMPYIGYFQAINAVDKYILYGNVNFEKKSWVNRNRLMQRNGVIEQMIVPIKKNSSSAFIKEIAIDYATDWQRRLLRSIQTNYGKAPYFEETYSLLTSIFSKEYEMLTELNTESIKAIARHLGITTEIVADNSQYDDMEERLRKSDDAYVEFPYMLKTRPNRRTARVIEMCKREESNHYINAIGGMELYCKEELAQYGIQLEFIKTKPIVYDQFNNKFEPYLSIIDVLMHNGKNKTKQMLEEYELV